MGPHPSSGETQFLRRLERLNDILIVPERIISPREYQFYPIRIHVRNSINVGRRVIPIVNQVQVLIEQTKPYVYILH